MVWYEIIGCVLGGSGIVGGIYSIFTMRVKKEGLVIDNLKQVINEIKEHHKEYKKETDEKFDKLEKEIAVVKAQNDFRGLAISKGYRCPFPPKEGTCPVIGTIESGCDLLTKNKPKK